LKQITHILTFLILLPFFGCDNPKPSNQIKEKPLENAAQINKPAPPETIAENQFSEEKIKQFGDSIISYFKTNAGYKIKSYEISIDTFNSEKYSAIGIKIKTNTFKTHGLISYDICTFPTNREATDYFNDLKTQELVCPMGINKRPNHILLDSNRVYWHHLEHPYGHRVKELTQIFYQKFNIHPQSTNRDSVSGFTYCHCINDDATISKIKGKMNIGSPIQIGKDYSNDPYYRCDCKNYISEKAEIILREDSISINGRSAPIEIISSIQLPDNRLFWKYYFYEEEDPEFEADFSKKLEKIKTIQGGLTLYQIKLTNHCYISFIRLDKGMTYMLADNEFYTLTK
jgi:hypothetical protein